MSSQSQQLLTVSCKVTSSNGLKHHFRLENHNSNVEEHSAGHIVNSPGWRQSRGVKMLALHIDKLPALQPVPREPPRVIPEHRGRNSS